MSNEYVIGEWQDVLDPFSSSPAEYGDLLLDIADAYTENGKRVCTRWVWFSQPAHLCRETLQGSSFIVVSHSHGVLQPGRGVA